VTATRSDNLHILEEGDRTVVVIGTAHVSIDSVDEVRAVIKARQPDVVCVELCEPRYQALTDKDRWQKLDIFEVIRSGKTLFLMANLAIGAYQRRLGAQLGVKPGAELVAAVEAAEEIGARVELVDREIHITLKRAWNSVGFLRRTQLLGAIFASLGEGDAKEKGGPIDREDIEELKEGANLSKMMEEFSVAMPEVKRTLIDERDQFMASKIHSAGGTNVVAVVGAGHVPGMLTCYGEPVDLEALTTPPRPTVIWKILKWLIPIAVLAAFAYGYSKQGSGSFQEMLFAWILPNSIFAGLLTALAGARPLSVLVAFVGSPITSLNPLIGTGMVTGLTEAWLRKPTVEDAERINDDVQSWRGFYRNPFTRVLLVAFASTIGSALGAYIGLGWVFTKLAT